MRLENSSKLLLLGISPKSHLLRTDDMLAKCGVFSLSEEFAEEDSDEYTAFVQRGSAAHARNSLGTSRAA